MTTTQAPDAPRLVPANCRQRLAAEGKPYPRSACAACGQLSPRWKECDALLAASPAVQPAAGREEIARLIDPEAMVTLADLEDDYRTFGASQFPPWSEDQAVSVARFSFDQGVERLARRQEQALAKADAILAAISTPAQASGEAKFETRMAYHPEAGFGLVVEKIAHPPAQASETGGEALAERMRIADALDYEASVLPCAEDAGVYRSAATLVRANFSYEDAEALSAPQAAPAPDLFGQGHNFIATCAECGVAFDAHLQGCSNIRPQGALASDSLTDAEFESVMKAAPGEGEQS